MPSQHILTDTGERMAPEFHKGQLIYAEHLVRYDAATQFVKDKVVLDIASGSGYGTQLLSKYAKKVFGVDNNADAIKYSQNNFSSINTEFIQGQATNIPLSDGVVDVVVSFETIEHIDDYQKFLNEIKRVLKPKGLALISTPNDKEFAEGNHFHVHEFEYSEMLKVLQGQFKYVQPNFQATWKFVAIGSEEMLRQPSFDRVPIANLAPLDADQSLYFCMICSDSPIIDSLQARGALGAQYSDKDLIASERAFQAKINSLEGEVCESKQDLNECTEELKSISNELNRTSTNLNNIESSKTYKGALFVYKTYKKVHRSLFIGTKTNERTFLTRAKHRLKREIVKRPELFRIAKRIRHLGSKQESNDSKYQQWIKNVEPHSLGSFAESEYDLRPLISIVIPAYNTPDRYLNPLIDSILAQTYSNWEVCLVQGGSSDSDRAISIRECVKLDNRIKLIESAQNLGIAGNTNLGIKAAKGDFIAFVDHDDMLAPFALAEVVKVLNQKSDVDLFYSDEDKISENGGKRLSPFFKPDWSPELFYSVNYLAHFVVLKSSLVKKVQGIREGFDGAQDYDFLLRILCLKPKIYHIPHISYHWRMAVGSTARTITAKGYADSAGKRALTDYLLAKGIKGEVVETTERPTNYRIKFALDQSPLISIIIPFKDKASLLEKLIDSILEKTAYSNFEIILISNNSKEFKTKQLLRELKPHPQIKILYYDQPFNYSAINNYGRKVAAGSVLVFMNNDMEVENTEWLEELVGVAIQPDVGIVGALLHYPNGSVQHAGVVLGMEGMAAHVFRNLQDETLTLFGIVDWPRNFLAVTGACLTVQAALFDKAGGFDEKFVVAGSDVALCLQIFELGFRNVFWPFAKIIHHESMSVGTYLNLQDDYDQSLKYYKPYLDGKDPYYNINLDLKYEQPTLNIHI